MHRKKSWFRQTKPHVTLNSFTPSGGMRGIFSHEHRILRNVTIAARLLVRGRRWHNVFGKLSSGRAMHHRVGVLNADTVSATMRLHDVHHRIVCIFRRPIALPLQHYRERT